MTWEVIPSNERAAALEALRVGRCVSCYGLIAAEHPGIYCCGCDDLCDHGHSSTPPGAPS